MHAGGWTIAFQAVNFLVLVWLLQRFLYKPVLAVIDRRKAESDRVLRDAAEAKQTADALRQQLDQERTGLGEERARALEAAHAAARAAQQSLMEAARAESAKLIAGAHEQIARERAEALTTLRKEAAQVSVELARRLLQTATPTTVPQGMIDQLLTMLEQRPESERARLLSTAATVEVLSAAPLTTDQSEALRRRLESFFGQSLRVQVREDPSLLAGLELHFPHSALRNTWRDRLVEAERLLGQA
jgi:F-type H+-transporting ATPase subunit b